MTDNMIELGKRAVACKGWRWMPGMATDSKFARVVAADAEGAPCAAETGATEDDCYAVWLAGLPLLPDLTDPATLGCLLALVREVWGEPRTVVVPLSGGRWGVAIPNVLRQSPTHKGDTEAEALVAALEGAP